MLIYNPIKMRKSLYPTFHFLLLLILQGSLPSWLSHSFILSFTLSTILWLGGKLIWNELVSDSPIRLTLLDCIPALLICYFVPESIVGAFSKIAVIAGISYKILEAIFAINVSFGTSRNLRERMQDDSMGAAGVILLIATLIMMGTSILLKVLVWRMDDQVAGIKLLVIVSLILEILLIVSTTIRAGVDCIASNWAFVSLYNSYRLYIYGNSMTHHGMYTNFSLSSYAIQYILLIFGFQTELEQKVSILFLFFLSNVLFPMGIIASYSTFKGEFFVFWEEIQSNEKGSNSDIYNILMVIIGLTIETYLVEFQDEVVWGVAAGLGISSAYYLFKVFLVD